MPRNQLTAPSTGQSMFETFRLVTPAPNSNAPEMETNVRSKSEKDLPRTTSKVLKEPSIFQGIVSSVSGFYHRTNSKHAIAQFLGIFLLFCCTWTKGYHYQWYSSGRNMSILSSIFLPLYPVCATTDWKPSVCRTSTLQSGVQWDIECYQSRP